MSNSLFHDINNNNKNNNHSFTFNSKISTESSSLNKKELPLLNYNSVFNLDSTQTYNFNLNNFNNGEESNVNNNTINKLIISSNNNSKNKSYKIFKVINSEASNLKKDKNKKYIKKGRKYNNLNKKIHTGGDDDNLIRKIQVHFITFIINFCNDVINALITDKEAPHFKDIDHQLKKTVNHKKIEYLKSLKLAHIVQLKPSSKMKNNDISVNKNIYEKICKHSPFIQEFLQMNYLDLFKQYYNNKSKLFEVNGQNIPISQKTKTFDDLLKKYDIYKKRLNYIAINYFLNRYKRIKKPNFKNYICNK